MKRLDELGVSPAPWAAIIAKDAVIGGGSDRCAWIEDDGGASICAMDRMTVDGAEKMGEAQFRANARLIAAAPDMYEALRLVLETIEHYGFQPWFRNDPLAVAVKCGEAALEKAGGGE